MKFSFSAVFLLGTALRVAASARYVMYIDQWHLTSLPSGTTAAGITHVIMAFATSELFLTSPAGTYTPFETVAAMRANFDAGTKIMVAIGGWGDNGGFATGCLTAASRATYAAGVAAMLTAGGFDGVDIDWEYPGGNGADYKQNPNSGKVPEIAAYPLLLQAIRSAIGPNKLLSIAVPGKIGDMIAFTTANSPSIWPSVDFVNVMTYDLMNRRDNITTHHTPIQGSLDTVSHYVDVLGLPPAKANLGIAFYAKWFTVDSTQTCTTGLGCATVLLEDSTGADTGKSGAVTFEASNFNGGVAYLSGGSDPSTAIANGVTDNTLGGQYYYDSANHIFWTWDTPALITKKFTTIIAAKNLGGIMAWSGGEDSYKWEHMAAMQAGVKAMNAAGCCTGTTTVVSATSTTAVVTSSTTSAVVTTTSAVVTTTSAVVTTTSVASTGTGVAQWGQCGGEGYTGPTVCASPYTCVATGAWWSQCE